MAVKPAATDELEAALVFRADADGLAQIYRGHRDSNGADFYGEWRVKNAKQPVQN